ncbi:ATP-binding protein [Methylosinus sp. PW1]|uniref:sensor histidine kinase n=1 Tax=Methylosinus sp. PW1 TaxID=107636 RepID=UPI00068CE981
MPILRVGRASFRVILWCDRPIRLSAENARIILSHLADNAARHGAAYLTIAAAAQSEDLCVAVRDNGSGASRANREKVFDSFFTTRRDSGGTGMDLAIVRAMLQAHGGSIALAEDGEGAPTGAAFVLTIPLANGTHRNHENTLGDLRGDHSAA